MFHRMQTALLRSVVLGIVPCGQHGSHYAVGVWPDTASVSGWWWNHRFSSWSKYVQMNEKYLENSRVVDSWLMLVGYMSWLHSWLPSWLLTWLLTWLLLGLVQEMDLAWLNLMCCVSLCFSWQWLSQFQLRISCLCSDPPVPTWVVRFVKETAPGASRFCNAWGDSRWIFTRHFRPVVLRPSQTLRSFHVLLCHVVSSSLIHPYFQRFLFFHPFWKLPLVGLCRHGRSALSSGRGADLDGNWGCFEGTCRKFMEDRDVV